MISTSTNQTQFEISNGFLPTIQLLQGVPISTWSFLNPRISPSKEQEGTTKKQNLPLSLERIKLWRTPIPNLMFWNQDPKNSLIQCRQKWRLSNTHLGQFPEKRRKEPISWCGIVVVGMKDPGNRENFRRTPQLHWKNGVMSTRARKILGAIWCLLSSIMPTNNQTQICKSSIKIKQRTGMIVGKRREKEG